MSRTSQRRPLPGSAYPAGVSRTRFSFLHALFLQSTTLILRCRQAHSYPSSVGFKQVRQTQLIRHALFKVGGEVGNAHF